MTQVALAEEMAVEQSYVSKIETEVIKVTPEVFGKLISALSGELKPVDLIQAMGYPVTVKGSDRLPHGLVRGLLAMTDDELAHLEPLVLRRVRPDHPSRTPRQ